MMAARPSGFASSTRPSARVKARPIYALYDLYVAPHARRSGAAHQLLLAAERQAAQDGKARMDLTTAKNNLAAQAAYESLGWVRDDVFLAYSRVIEA
jgi:ribosomal protein S18 acetylase RimI-like enzyme